MEEVVGDGWEMYFDLILTECKKPLFYKSEAPFSETYRVDDEPLKTMSTAEELQ